MPLPSWWDVESLFERHANRRAVLPDNREVLLLDWTDLLGFDLQQGRKTWEVPEKKVEDREIQEQREVLLEAFQEAEWFIIARERVWVVPEQARPGCDVWEGPPWWNFFYGDSAFRAWYQAFWETHRLNERRFEMSNPIWIDYVSLLTGPEAMLLDERCRESYRAFKMGIGQKRLTAYIRREMARFARSLRQAEWILLYEYEWESGLA